MNKNVELLAPAGTYEAFLAAIENGANAVYMGGKLFNARANAANFDISELADMVKYAHLRNVKIHITMNTLLSDNEVSEALVFAKELYNIGVDALIIQDLGLAKVIHKYLPDFPLHASTQLSTHSLSGVEKLSEIGFSRIVLARELSIDEIKFISDNSNVELEIFAHGALCVSYSGQCLMSSMIGDRSGNRGKCAQPCRLPYTLIKDGVSLGTGYLLSPKDLATIDILNRLPNITSLKIEGRMKSPEYVATVISTYRKYIDKLPDSNINPEDKTNLMQIFNRGGFSTGYLEKNLGKDLMCYEKPKNWGLYVGKVIHYDGKYITIDYNNDISLNIGDGIEIWNGEPTSPATIISEISGNKVGRISGNIRPQDKVFKTFDKTLNMKARESFSRGSKIHSNINVKVNILAGLPIIVEINDFSYRTAIIPEVASNQPITIEKVKFQFSKTGNTPFKVENIDICLDNNLFVPVSILNEIRRQAIERYEEFLLSSNIRNASVPQLSPIVKYKNSSPKFSTNKTHEKNSIQVIKNENINNRYPEVSVFLNIFRNEYLLLKNVDNFYFNFKDVLNNIDCISKLKCNKFALFPTITKKNYEKLIINNIEKVSKIVDGFVISNIGQLKYISYLANTCDISSIKLVANYTFNTFNTYTIDLLESLNFSKVILSPELTKSQINSLGGNLKREVISYGKVCVMTSNYCPIGSLLGSFDKNSLCKRPCMSHSSNRFYLRDRLNMDFLILPDNIDCITKIFNPKTTSIESANLNIDSIRIDVIDESLTDLQRIIDIHRKGKKLSGEEYTNGHYNRPV